MPVRSRCSRGSVSLPRLPHVRGLQARIPDFRRAFQPDGLTVEDFDIFGATVRTLRGFIAFYWDLVRAVDDILLPNPDARG